MRNARSIQEVELRFRPRGLGRFGGAAFLIVWLCGWLGGEVFALFVLGSGIYSLVTGKPPLGGDEPLRLAPALAIGAFLLVWLTLWTFGGVMAIRELLRALWAEDRLSLDRETLVCIRRLGPFRSTQRLAREELRRVFVQPAGGVLAAQAGANVIELATLGTVEERTEAARTLNAALGVPEKEPDAGQAGVPEDWQEVAGPYGEQLLVPNLHTRKKQGVVVAIITIVVWTGVALLARESLREPGMWTVTAPLAALAVWLTWQTLWLFHGRKEWRIDRGKLVHQRRFADGVTELADASGLELIEASDSESTLYELRAVGLSRPVFGGAGKVPERLTIERSLNDPTEARCLGLWLARQAGIPFHDRVPTRADKDAETARLKEQLAASGKFGRFLAGLLGRAGR